MNRVWFNDLSVFWSCNVVRHFARLFLESVVSYLVLGTPTTAGYDGHVILTVDFHFYNATQR